MNKRIITLIIALNANVRKYFWVVGEAPYNFANK